MPDRGKYIELLSKAAEKVKEFNEDVPIKMSLVCMEDILELLKAQPEIEHIEKDVTYPADMLTPGDVMASIGFNEQIAGHIGNMLLENGAVRIETLEEYEGPYHMVRFHLSADVVKQRKEGEKR